MSMLEGHGVTDLQAVSEQVAQTVGAPEELCLGESSSRPERHLLLSSARVNNECKERRMRCAKQEQCREDTLQG